MVAAHGDPARSGRHDRLRQLGELLEEVADLRTVEQQVLDVLLLSPVDVMLPIGKVSYRKNCV